MVATTLERVGPAVVTVRIPWEPLEPGPSGARVQVIDFDGGSRVEGGSSAATHVRINGRLGRSQDRQQACKVLFTASP
jgi:hypothetical protein